MAQARETEGHEARDRAAVGCENGRTLRIWAISDGRTGIAVQAQGLAEAVARRASQVGYAAAQVQTVHVRPRAPWRWLPPRMQPRALSVVEVLAGPALAPPWPDVAISTGRKSSAVTAAIRARARAAGQRVFAVHIQRPYLPAACFDLLVSPRHDRVPSENAIATRGALGLVSRERLAAEAEAYAAHIADLPRPLIAVAVGGANRVFRFGAAEARQLGERLRRAQSETGGALLVTVSRRTSAAVRETLRAALADLPGRFHDGQGQENPYLAFLASADAIVVTCDSVNMASEAAATGAPVHVFDLPGGSRKFAEFHADLREAGIAHPFEGSVETRDGEAPAYTPLDETGRVAEAVVRRLGAQR